MEDLKRLYPISKGLEREKWDQWLQHPLTQEYLRALRRCELELRGEKLCDSTPRFIAQADAFDKAVRLVAAGSLTTEASGELIRLTTHDPKRGAQEEA